METKNYSKIIASLVIVLALIVVFVPSIKPRETQPETLNQALPQTQMVTITIPDLYTDQIVSIPAGSTVLQLLQQLNIENRELRLVTEEYEGLGVLVTGLAGQTNGVENKYWQYEVNSLMPQVGASALVLKEGDAVTWYFRESEF